MDHREVGALIRDGAEPIARTADLPGCATQNLGTEPREGFYAERKAAELTNQLFCDAEAMEGGDVMWDNRNADFSATLDSQGCCAWSKNIERNCCQASVDTFRLVYPRSVFNFSVISVGAKPDRSGLQCRPIDVGINRSKHDWFSEFGEKRELI